jgi:hypothetical protein
MMIVFGPLERKIDVNALSRFVRDTLDRARNPLWFWEDGDGKRRAPQDAFRRDPNLS